MPSSLPFVVAFRDSRFEAETSKKQLSIRCFPWDDHALWPNVCIDASANAMIFIAVGRFTR